MMAVISVATSRRLIFETKSAGLMGERARRREGTGRRVVVAPLAKFERSAGTDPGDEGIERERRGTSKEVVMDGRGWGEDGLTTKGVSCSCTIFTLRSLELLGLVCY